MTTEVDVAPPLVPPLDLDITAPPLIMDSIVTDSSNSNNNIYNHTVDQALDGDTADCGKYMDNENDDNNENDNNNDDDEDVDDAHIGDEDDAHDEIFGQRSDSDSEMDSPDDFSAVDSDQIPEAATIRHREPTSESDNKYSAEHTKTVENAQKESNITPAENFNTSETDTEVNQSNAIVQSTIETENENPATNESNPHGTDPSSDSEPAVIAQQDSSAIDTEPSCLSNNSSSDGSNTTVPPAPENFPALGTAVLADKMEDGDVSKQTGLMDSIQGIGLTDLSRLKGLDKADPTVRRLFVRPRVTTRELMSLTIDPDIKAVVDEFLKNNIVGNFIIARVLRENYALFYSWLSTHIQSERNAWAVRLRQALVQAEQHRKDSIDISDLVVHSAARLRHLVQSASNTMFGLPTKGHHHHHHRRGTKSIRSISQRRQGASTTKSVASSSSGVSSNAHSIPNINGRDAKDAKSSTGLYPFSVDMDDKTMATAYQNRKSNFQNRLMAMSRLNERSIAAMAGNKGLTQSSFNVVSVVDTSRVAKNPEAEASVRASESEAETKDDATTSGNGKKPKPNVKIQQNAPPNWRHGGGVHVGKLKKKGNHPFEYNEEEFKALYADGGDETDDVVVGYDEEETDWKQVLRDNIEVLTDICDTLVNDRTECLRLVGVKPNAVASLVEAVSGFVKDRHYSGHNKRKEIERRLGMLEAENKNLQNEMTVLQNTLKEKNNDALNLQRQLDKVENMLKDNMNSKVHKCVGTDDFLSLKTLHKNGHKTRKSPAAFDDKNSNNKGPLTNGVGLKIPVGDMDEAGLRLESKQILRSVPAEQEVKQSGKSTNETPVGNITEKQNINLTAEVDSGMRPTREPSLIEISEEKLKTLKQRARKLEDSLHDAITSMEKLNKVTPHDDSASMHSTTSGSTITSILVKPSRSYMPRHHHHYWKKASLEVNGVAPESARIPKLTVIRRPGFISERRCQSEHPPSITLESEHTSFLEGKSVVQAPSDGSLSHRTPAPHDVPYNTPIPSTNMRNLGDRLNGITPLGVTPVSRISQTVDYTSGEENYFSEDNFRDDELSDTPRRKGKSIAGSNNGGGGGEKWASSSTSTSKRKARVISRFRPTGGGMVAKCLRCQKLFSSVDNHKLACCYHLKGKERLEHYDHCGRLLRVLYAWKCCRQPQDAEGCCYGQHV
ncbi:uncharacterized protein LOC101852615 [Aplysia californica]|uniref:Uncharacterized protein LOC101852615 n=1 Tax=Aplysia californica TaxID=6500 RepID=A0ABM0JJX1_APLCA|nr:uncharacterized protein LOC101852615 [Aplysia californica]